MVTRKSNSRMFSVLLIVAMLIGTVAFPYPTHAAASIVVNSNADTIANDGACTLREAITNANGDSQLYATAGECSAGSGADTISFAANYTITLVGSQLPAVTTAITINGNGEANTIIQANAVPNTATYRVFEASAAGNLTLNSLTVRNGRCNGSCATNSISGGGIYNAGTLTVSNVTFSANSAANYGGGMYNTNSSATLMNVTFSSNSGGGMYNDTSSATLTNVTFSANSSYSGGGMGNYLSNPTLTNVTFNANSSYSSASGGGGMFNYASSPTLTNVTFNANSAANYGFGGGMLNSYSSPTLTNVIIANSGSGGDCMDNTGGSLNAASTNNLIEGTGANACGLTNAVNGNIIGSDPMLGVLANNGGFTPTHALLAGSPAINAGTNTGCTATDQRGVTRPQGSHCDIGAYERSVGGDFVWAKGIGGTGDDRGSGVITDSNGNIYSTGNFSATVDFDPGLGTSNLISNGSGDIFISKFDTNGSMVWAKNMGGSGFDFGADIAIDSNANIYIIGSYTGTVDFDPGAALFNLSSVSSSGDIFLAKFDPNGNFVWAKSMGGAKFDQGLNITLDANNNIYAMGDFSGTADFDPGAGVSNLVSAGWFDIFITKFDSFGNFVWAKGVGGTGEDYASGISTDSVGNIYATGSFSATADFDPNVGVLNLVSNGAVDLFIAKLTSSGELSWAKKMGGTGDDEGFDIIVDSDNNVYTTGIFSDTIDIDPGINEAFISSAGFTDIFVAKLDGNGNFMWAENMGGTRDDFGVGITKGPNNDIYLMGFFMNTVDFNPAVGIFNMTSAGSFDVFVISLAGNGDFLWAKGMGGTGGDYGYSMALDGGNNIYTTGSFSGTAEFDPGIGVFNLNSAGLGDIFISKLYNDVNPIVSSIIRANPSPTAAASVNFTVNFSESVTGVDVGDFTLTTTGSVSGATVSGLSGSGSVYTVTVNTGNGPGTIRLNMMDDNSIADAALNPLGGAGVGDGNFTSGETYSISSFGDVSTSHWAWKWIESFYQQGITMGCAQTPVRLYCPENNVTRAEMAVFVERALHGASYQPPVVGLTFNDISGHWAQYWIERFKSEGITTGCGGGKYCPDQNVTRAEMSVFILRALHGGSYQPPVVALTFNDTSGHWAQYWIEQFKTEGITTGCGGGKYCPDQNVTRAEMAVFLVRAFGYPVLP